MISHQETLKHNYVIHFTHTRLLCEANQESNCAQTEEVEDNFARAVVTLEANSFMAGGDVIYKAALY